MTSKIKNIIIIVVVAVILFLVYIFFLKPAPAVPNLTTSTKSATLPSATEENSTAIGADFLSTLLSVKSIKLDDSIFSDSAFATLHDSSIVLTPDATGGGRPNPFAPIGSDVLPATSNIEVNVLAPTNNDSEPTSNNTKTGLAQ